MSDDRSKDPSRGSDAVPPRPVPVSGRPAPARPTAPPPARPGGAEASGGRSRSRAASRKARDRRGRGDGGGGKAPPTPVRDLPGAEAPAPPTPPDVETIDFSVDGESWQVRVLGRASVGGAAAVPALLLGFRRPGSEPPSPATRDVGERETLVVGRTLEGLTPLELENAFRASSESAATERRPAPGPRARRERGGATGGEGP